MIDFRLLLQESVMEVEATEAFMEDHEMVWQLIDNLHKENGNFEMWNVKNYFLFHLPFVVRDNLVDVLFQNLLLIKSKKLSYYWECEEVWVRKRFYFFLLFITKYNKYFLYRIKIIIR